MRPQLFVFAKRPDMGRAKTRLARDIGPVHAQRIARAMNAQVLRRVRDPRWETVIYGTPRDAIGTVPDWEGYPQIAQPDGSLTPRLAHVFGASRRPVCVIGQDSPDIRARDIADAFAALRQHDFVFGPARDGGFWLMAARAPLKPGTFENVRWSTEHTLDDLRRNLDGSVATLRTLVDVDDLEGLRAWKRRLPLGQARGWQLTSATTGCTRRNPSSSVSVRRARA